MVQFMLNVVQVRLACGCRPTRCPPPPAACSDGVGCPGVCGVCAQPESNGIGGGCMPLIYMRGEGTVHAFDGREEAPAAFSEDAFCKYPSCNESWRFWPERVTGGAYGTWVTRAHVYERALASLTPLAFYPSPVTFVAPVLQGTLWAYRARWRPLHWFWSGLGR